MPKPVNVLSDDSQLGSGISLALRIEHLYGNPPPPPYRCACELCTFPRPVLEPFPVPPPPRLSRAETTELEKTIAQYQDWIATSDLAKAPIVGTISTQFFTNKLIERLVPNLPLFPPVPTPLPEQHIVNEKIVGQGAVRPNGPPSINKGPLYMKVIS